MEKYDPNNRNMMSPCSPESKKDNNFTQNQTLFKTTKNKLAFFSIDLKKKIYENNNPEVHRILQKCVQYDAKLYHVIQDNATVVEALLINCHC